NSLLRNRGNGTFEDVSQKAAAAFGRWAWSSDALDFDNDGWEDLYVVNGMFTREDDQPSIDVDSFFWRQVVAQSPLARTPGMPYDDGWRATNRLLLSGGSQAHAERNGGLGTSAVAAALAPAAAAVPKRFCERPCGGGDSPDRDEEQPRRDWSSGHGRDRSRPVHPRRPARTRILFEA